MTSEQRRADHPMRAWVQLFALLGLLWAFVFVAIPAAQRLPYIEPGVGALLDSGIEVSALYYTGVEKVAEAEAAVRAATSRSRP